MAYSKPYRESVPNKMAPMASILVVAPSSFFRSVRRNMIIIILLIITEKSQLPVGISINSDAH